MINLGNVPFGFQEIMEATMMKKIVFLLISMLLFASTCFANDNAVGIKAREEFDAITKDIVSTVEASYKNKDTSVKKVQHGWIKVNFSKLSYVVSFEKTGIKEAPYKAVLETHHYEDTLYEKKLYKPFKSKAAAEKAIEPDIYNWESEPDNGVFNKFVYNYVNGSWQLVETKYATWYESKPNTGYNKIMEEWDSQPVYMNYKNNKVYSPLEVLLVKNVGNVDVQY